MKIRPPALNFNKTPLGLWAKTQTSPSAHRVAKRVSAQTGLPFPIVKAHLHLAGLGVDGDKW
jgi:hypothetical protein